jgi:hypothetical protein
LLRTTNTDKEYRRGVVHAAREGVCARCLVWGCVLCAPGVELMMFVCNVTQRQDDCCCISRHGLPRTTQVQTGRSTHTPRLCRDDCKPPPLPTTTTDLPTCHHVVLKKGAIQQKAFLRPKMSLTHTQHTCGIAQENKSGAKSGYIERSGVFSQQRCSGCSSRR